MKKLYTTTLLFLLVSISSIAQDYTVNAPYTSPSRNTCGAASNCGLRPSEDHEYQVTIPYAGNWTFSLCGASFDTYMYIGTSLCSSNIAQNDDFCGLDSEITVAAMAAGTYFVTVEGYSSGACGNYTLAITGPPPPVGLGEDCATAIAINCGDVVAGNTSTFAVDLAPFCGTGDGSGGGVWYEVTATCTAMTASLCGSAYDTKIRVFTGTCAALICETGIDDFCGLQSEVSWASTPGTTYYILVHGYGGATGAYTLNLTCSGCGSLPPVADFSAPTTVCTGNSATFTDLTTNIPTSWNWSFPGGTPATSTLQNPVVTYAATGTYNVTLTATNATGTDTEVKNGYITVIDCAGACVGNYYYVRSNSGGSPWGSTSNETAMDAVFGGGNWIQAYFETVNPAVLFGAGTCTIFMDGSDAGATEFETFLDANMVTMENWVAAGGRIFLNTAPNEDNGMAYGFGGTTMVYPNGLTATGTSVAPAHAIFNGPFLPVGLAWTGNWFAHGTISNAGIPLIQEGANIVCSEKFYGAGVAVFGSMTTANWHTPALEGQNLRQNILCYISPPIICGVPLPVELSTFAGVSEDGVNILSWTTASEHHNDYFSVERSEDAINFHEFTQVDGAGSSLIEHNYGARDEDPFNGVTYYRLKQVDFDGEFDYSDIIALDNKDHSKIDVFPSPADKIITVTMVDAPSNAVSVAIRNAVGKQVISTEFKNKIEVVDVSDLPSGIYFITMTIDGETTVKKFAVK